MTEELTLNGDVISFGSPAFQKDNRFKAYDALRENAPVYKDPQTGNYVLTRYADVRKALTKFQIFSNDAGMVGRRETPQREMIDRIYLEKGPLPGRNLQTYDPPEHKIHRAPVDRAFDHWNMMGLRDFIEQQANKCIDAFIDAGEVEFVSGFAIPFPLTVFADQLGVAEEDALKLKLWADVAVEEISPVLTPDREIEIAKILASMYEYFQHSLEKARQKPDDRLISKLLQTTTPDGKPLDMPELLEVMRAMVVAAGDTTSFAISGGMKLLVDNPEIALEIRDDEAKQLAFIEETLRICSPVQTLFRRAVEDFELYGVTIPKGSIVEVRYGAADLDAEAFACPHQIDLARKNGRAHLAFGIGTHACLGMGLARTEMEIGFREILRRMENFRPAKGIDSFEMSPVYMANGPTNAYIAFDKR